MSRFVIIIGVVVATATIASADVEVAPPRTELAWYDFAKDPCQLEDRNEPASTCKLLAKTTVKGVGTFALYDTVSWHDIWMVETPDAAPTRLVHVEAYGSLSSAGHARTPSRFVARARSSATAAGFELAFDFEDVSEHTGGRSRSHERVFLACDDRGCHEMAFGAGPWVKHACTTTGWTKSPTLQVAYACTGVAAL
jgi:hypothetical protein